MKFYKGVLADSYRMYMTEFVLAGFTLRTLLTLFPASLDDFSATCIFSFKLEISF